MRKSLKGFDFRHIQNADIGVTWPWGIALLLENYSEYFDDFTCWLSDERALPLLIGSFLSLKVMKTCITA